MKTPRMTGALIGSAVIIVLLALAAYYSIGRKVQDLPIVPYNPNEFKPGEYMQIYPDNGFCDTHPCKD